MSTCRFCNFQKQKQCQFIYDKVYKEDCLICKEYNNTESIYCLCNNKNNFLEKKQVYICENFCCCYNCSNTDINKTLIYTDLHDSCINNYSYKDLYQIAKDRQIKYRSSMSKNDLYNVLFSI